MNNSELKKEFQERFLELRKILNSCDLIPGSPKDEFDSLNHKILSYLYKGADMGKITRVLDSELTVNYGLSPNLKDVEKIAAEIIGWWSLNNSM
ncbi:hypothetical protein [uncultured Pontibacter sp.]|uniref:hypothetical protein n=1 Tax=uncultured Pontibacter sp. TaxID=453356 RepID=UPI002607338A|nr:hypothetical protein [uncultured Pontibacter sp.]